MKVPPLSASIAANTLLLGTIGAAVTVSVWLAILGP